MSNSPLNINPHTILVIWGYHSQLLLSSPPASFLLSPGVSHILPSLLTYPPTLRLSGDVRVMEIIPLLIPDKETDDWEDTINTVLTDKVAPKARGIRQIFLSIYSPLLSTKYLSIFLIQQQV